MVSGKFREIDILGKMSFSTNQKELQYSEIAIIIEVKSLSNYHLIFDADLKNNKILSNYAIWPGYDIYNQYSKLKAILERTEFSSKQKKEFINFFKNKTFPDEFSAIAEIKPPTFREINSYTSFRETNTNVTKDLGNSVLWKSFQSLESACRGYEDYMWESLDNDIIYFSESLLSNKSKKIEGIDLDSDINRHISLHKILVVEANLWNIIDNKPSEINYCRLVQSEIYDDGRKWIDVVNFKYFDEYITNVTKHYLNFYENKQMKRSH